MVKYLISFNDTESLTSDLIDTVDYLESILSALEIAGPRDFALTLMTTQAKYDTITMILDGDTLKIKRVIS